MPQERTVIEAIIIASVVFALVGGFVVAYLLYFKKRKSSLLQEQEHMKEAFRKELLLAQVEMQESTFLAVGRELHDNIGQLLGTAKMLVGVSQRNPSAAADTLRTTDETLSQAIYELRSLSKTLNKEWLEQFNFKENLQTEINRIRSVGTISILLSDRTRELTLSPEQQTILFRIVQEALQNAIRHALARTISIALESNSGTLHITISDDGTGFRKQGSSDGVGIIHMKQRAALLHADIRWQSSGDGTTVTLKIPPTGTL